MKSVARGSDGRRLFTAEFKREQIDRVLRGEVTVSELRSAQARVKELERLVGKQALELEILRVAREEVKKRPRWYSVSGKRREDPSP